MNTEFPWLLIIGIVLIAMAGFSNCAQAAEWSPVDINSNGIYHTMTAADDDTAVLLSASPSGDCQLGIQIAESVPNNLTEGVKSNTMHIQLRIDGLAPNSTEQGRLYIVKSGSETFGYISAGLADVTVKELRNGSRAIFRFRNDANDTWSQTYRFGLKGSRRRIDDVLRSCQEGLNNEWGYSGSEWEI